MRSFFEKKTGWQMVEHSSRPLEYSDVVNKSSSKVIEGYCCVYTGLDGVEGWFAKSFLCQTQLQLRLRWDCG